MTRLTIEQRQQLTDYQLGLLSEEEAAEVREFLEESSQAREFLKRVEQSLAPLNALGDPEVPDSLVPLTLARVSAAAALEGQQSAKALEFPSERSSGRVRPRLLRFPELLTMAASIALVVGLFIPAVRHWRYASVRHNCASQQASIGSAIRSYASANNGSLPFIPEKVGKPWMRSGRTAGKRIDTSNLFLLVRLGYIKPQAFVCPGVPHRPEDLNYSTAKLDDFPSESMVSYSYQNMFGRHRPTTLDSPRGFVILADRNPLLMLGPRLTVAKLFLAPSPNHGSDRGQNVLRLDWSVNWSTTPKVGFKEDNIWQPADLAPATDDSPTFRGHEVPANSQDSFLN